MTPPPERLPIYELGQDKPISAYTCFGAMLDAAMMPMLGARRRSAGLAKRAAHQGLKRRLSEAWKERVLEAVSVAFEAFGVGAAMRPRLGRQPALSRFSAAPLSPPINDCRATDGPASATYCVDDAAMIGLKRRRPFLDSGFSSRFRFTGLWPSPGVLRPRLALLPAYATTPRRVSRFPPPQQCHPLTAERRRKAPCLTKAAFITVQLPASFDRPA